MLRLWSVLTDTLDNSRMRQARSFACLIAPTTPSDYEEVLKPAARQLLAQAVLEKQLQQAKQPAPPAAAASAASTDEKLPNGPKLLSNAAQSRPRDEL